MISQILFNLPGRRFSCSLSCSACRRSIFILSGIHFRAVGLLMPNSAAHLDTLPSGWARNHSSTLACRVGAPALLILGSSAVNLAILSPPALAFFSIARHRRFVQLFFSNLPCKITGNYRQNRVRVCPVAEIHSGAYKTPGKSKKWWCQPPFPCLRVFITSGRAGAPGPMGRRGGPLSVRSQ